MLKLEWYYGGTEPQVVDALIADLNRLPLFILALGVMLNYLILSETDDDPH